MHSRRRPWRRPLLTALVALAAALSLPPRSLQSQQGCSGNAIVCENQLTGNLPSEWDISGAGDSSIQGFTTDISVNKGEVVHFKVTTPAPTFRMDIYRLGYYGGRGARKVASLSNLTGRQQASCLTNSSTGLIDCGNWIENATWTVPPTAVSGIYIAKIIRNDTGGASHIAFVVRDDAAQAPIVFQTSDTTWQAYNTYAGNSLYVGGPGTNPGRAYKVSYNRPITTRATSAEDWIFNAEYPMLRFLEANGYDMSYITGVDTDRYGVTELPRHRIFLSVGHDEYWSKQQRANVEAARNAGVHLAFFSGNEVFWKTRWENSIDGTSTPYRTLVSYKESHRPTSGLPLDPLDPPTWTGLWRDGRMSNADGGVPENALTGTISTVNCCTTTAAIRATAAHASHRFWRNTRVASLTGSQSTTFTTGTLGYEWDENLNNGFRPAGLTALSSATYSADQKIVQLSNGMYDVAPGTATHSMTLYQHLSGALVFGAGTVQYSWALDGTHDRGSSTPDIALQQATVNLLSDMGVEAGSLRSGLVPGAPVPDTQAPVSTITGPSGSSTVAVGATIAIAGTATDSGGGTVAAVQVSTDGGTTWSNATGTTSWSFNWTPTATGTFTIRSRAIDNSNNTETPGAGVTITVAAVAASGLSIDAIAWGDQPLTSSRTVTTGAFSTTSPSELLLAFVAADDRTAGNTVSGISGGGLTWQLVLRTNTQRGTAEIWRAFAGVTLTNVSVTATLAQAVASSVTVVAFKGADSSGTNGAGAIGATRSANASTGAPTATLTTTRAGSWVFGVGVDWDNPISRTLGPNQTLIHQYMPPVGDTYWVQRMTSTTPASGTGVTINATAPTTDRWNLSVLEVLPAVAAVPVTVPEVTGQTTAAASTLLTIAGLSLGTTSTASSSNVDAGLIISQSPAAGTTVASGTPVNLVVSSGPPPIPVPPVTGLTQDAASSAIVTAGFTVGSVTTAWSTSVPIDLVTGQTPSAGSMATPGSAVAIVVSAGPPPTPVPSVVGATQADAVAAITVGAAVASAPVPVSVNNTSSGTAATVTINPSAFRQTIDGIGGNYAFEGSHISDPVGQFTWQNMSVAHVRVQMNLAEWEPANDNSDAQSFVWTAFQDTGRTHSNFLQMQAFRDKGISIVASIWNVPNWMVSNPANTAQRVIPSSMYDEAVESIAGYLLAARDTYGVSIPYVSFNEADGGYYTLFSSSEMATFIKRAGPRFAALGLTTKWIVGETINPSALVSYASPILADATASQYIGPIGVHSWNATTYADSVFSGIYTLASQHSRPVWVTEVGLDPQGWQTSGYTTTWSFALDMAKTYYRLLRLSRASAFDYWEYGNDYPVVNSSTLSPYPVYFVIKALAEGFTPGMTVVDATVSDPNILAVAAKDGTGKMAVYAINAASSAYAVTFSNLPSTPLMMVRSTTAQGGAVLGPFVPSSGSLKISMPAQSVITLVPVASTDPVGTGTADLQVNLTAPGAGATLTGAVTLAASVTDPVVTSGVQFQVDGNAVGAEDTTQPFQMTWDSSAVSNGNHSIRAVARIAGAGLAVGSITQAPSSTVAAGLVLSQTPSPGTMVPGGSSVNLVISSGPTPVAVPDVVNLTAAEASAAILAAALGVGNQTTATSDLVPAGSVVSQDPAAGTLVAPGTKVNLVIARDSTPPQVSITTPADGSTVVGSAVALTADANDNVGVVGVQFQVDGTQLGAADSTAPYGAVWDSTALSNGSHSLTAVASDAAGNTASSTVSVTVSNPPKISAVVATGITSSSALVSWTTNMAATTQVNYGLTSSYGATTPLESSLTTAHAQTLSGLDPSTTYHYQVVSVDGFGNSTSSPDLTFKTADPPDTTFPEVSIGAPSDGASVSGTSATISAIASDNVGVISVQFKLDGANLGNPDTSAPYSTVWNTTTGTNGPHTLTAVASDAAGNSTTSAPIGVSVANLPAISAVSAGSISGSSATISWTTNMASTSRVNYGPATPYATSTAVDPALVTAHSMTLRGLAGSTLYHYQVVSTDAYGNTSTSGDFTFTTADTTDPTVSITAPAEDATVSGSSVTVSATASDNMGVAGVQFKLDGANLGSEDTTAPYAVTWNTTTATNGPHTLTAVARDAAGNSTTSTDVAVTVSNSAALAIDATVWADKSSTSTKSFTTGRFSTTAASELLLAFISADDITAGNTVTSVTGAGLTWVLAVRTNTQRGTAEVWRAFATGTLTNVTVTANLAQAAAASMTIVSFRNADQSGTNGSGAIGATRSANGSSGAPTGSITTTRSGSWVFGVGTDWDRPQARTVGANQTLIHQYMPPVGDTYWVQRTSSTIPGAGTPVTINDTAPTNDRWNLSIVEVRQKP